MRSKHSHFAFWIALGLCPGLACVSPAGAAPADSGIQVLQRWQIGGAGGWDYLTLDPGAGRLFISRATHVDVISTESGKLVGSISDTPGVHGIALAKSLKRGYTSNGRANSVTVFDLDTLKVIQEAKVSGSNPDAILYDPAGKHVFTFNGASKDVTVLDAVGFDVLATIAVPGKPEFAADDGNGEIFVNIETDPGQLTVIDSRKLAVKATWPLPGCNSPSGLAIDNIHHRLFSVCDGRVMAVTDSLSGRQVALVPIGEHPDAAAYDAKRRLVYSSNGEGNLTVVRQDSADHYSVLATVATQLGARTMALDAASGKVYLVTAEFGPAPPATEAQPRPRPPIKADSFVVLTVGRTP